MRLLPGNGIYFNVSCDGCSATINATSHAQSNCPQVTPLQLSSTLFTSNDTLYFLRQGPNIFIGGTMIRTSEAWPAMATHLKLLMFEDHGSTPLLGATGIATTSDNQMFPVYVVPNERCVYFNNLLASLPQGTEVTFSISYLKPED